MKKVQIRQCPVWGSIHEHAASVAAALRKEPGVQVEVVEGGHGEFTVSVDGRVVAQKTEGLPPANDVLAAVRKS